MGSPKAVGTIGLWGNALTFGDEISAVGQHDRYSVKQWTCLLLVRFVSGDSVDDNSQNCWLVMVHGQDGKPVKGAALNRANALASEGFLEFKLHKDMDAALAEVREEMLNHPDNLSARFFMWQLRMRQQPGSEVNAMIRHELDSLYQPRMHDAQALSELVSGFQLTGQLERWSKIR